MTEYLCWGQVQQKLTEHYKQYGEAYSFHDAVLELCEENACHYANRLLSTDRTHLFSNNPALWDEALWNFPFETAPHRAGQTDQSFHGEEYLLRRVAWHRAMRIHSYPLYQVCYVMKGQGTLLFGSKENAKPLTEGDFCILSPGLAHDVAAEENSQIFTLLLSEDTIEQTLYHVFQEDTVFTRYFRRTLAEHQDYIFMHLEADFMTLFLWRSLWSLQVMPKNYYRKVVFGNLLEIIFVKVLEQEENTEPQSPMNTSMLPVLNYLRANIRDVSLSQLAAQFGYEPGYLGKRIKRETGMSYSEIVRDLRVQEGKQLLKNQSLSISQIANSLGYSSVSNFHYQFKAVTGQTPNEYRSQL